MEFTHSATLMEVKSNMKDLLMKLKSELFYDDSDLEPFVVPTFQGDKQMQEAFLKKYLQPFN